MKPRNRPHIYLQSQGRPESFSRPRQLVVSSTVSRDRSAHGDKLKADMRAAEAAQEARRLGLQLDPIEGGVEGLYLVFQGPPRKRGESEPRLNLDGLDMRSRGVELRNVRLVEVQPDLECEEATVFVPDGALAKFLKDLDKYKKSAARSPKFDYIEAIRLATLRALWTDSVDSFPSSETEPVWWEVWLGRADDSLERFEHLCARVGADRDPRVLYFRDRIVVNVHASPRQLASSTDLLSDLAELRRPAVAKPFFTELKPWEQGEWADDLRDRLGDPAPDAPAVCVLDTGVNRGHKLLEPLLPQASWLTIHPDSGAHDHEGHGTEMAGLAAYGDLVGVLETKDYVEPSHGLESVKILPRGRENEPGTYGAVTVEAVALAETVAPDRRRVVLMAVSAEDRTQIGEPTAWSAAVDAIAAGRGVDAQADRISYADLDGSKEPRLLVVAAGNLDFDPKEDARTQAENAVVEDPGQAWNVLTVGAHTDKHEFFEDQYPDWRPAVEAGDLSPYSRTGVSFHRSWPSKPDVVFEGGNIAVSPSREDKAEGIEPLSVLTTHRLATHRPLTTSWATSAASAQVAGMTAALMADQPDRWPETLRGLLVHSARWNERMLAAKLKSKNDWTNLVRTFGFGVPDLARATRSADDALTLVLEDRLVPFRRAKDSKALTLGDMHFIDLPWPTEVLQDLGDQLVSLRVTLSYFIEPNPGRRGWRTRHRYASHGLRFDVIRSTESPRKFRQRINAEARDPDVKHRAAASDSDEWCLGAQARTRGSLHSDIWRGPASYLALRNKLAVYPATGWWKDQPKHYPTDVEHEGVRYALIVSIEAEEVDVDLWTPVATQVGLPVGVEVEIE